MRKMYRLRRHAHRDVDITVPATSDQIDAHQSADSQCKASVHIVDTFGTTPYE